MTIPGLFLSFEGLDGSGKSTQMQRLGRRLRELGHPVVETIEPGGTSIGEQIRRILLDPENRQLGPRTEILLYFAARAQNVSELILPALSQGAVVLSDRFTDSTLAYQGSGRWLGQELVRQLHQIACGDVYPRMTIYLDLDLATSRKRSSRRGSLDRLESNDAEFFERVRATYHGIAEEEPERFRMIDARGTEDEVAARIWELVSPLLPPGEVR